MAEDDNLYEVDFFRWFKDRLKDKGLQFSQCGFKLGQSLGSRHDINLQTGFWKEPNYSANKPPRWLYQIEPAGAGWKGVNPAKGALNLGAINASQEDKAGVVFRLVPRGFHRLLAIGEAVAHLNYLRGRGQVVRSVDPGGIVRFVAA